VARRKPFEERETEDVMMRLNIKRGAVCGMENVGGGGKEKTAPNKGSGGWLTAKRGQSVSSQMYISMGAKIEEERKHENRY
jgi:hypothetical protein